MTAVGWLKTKGFEELLQPVCLADDAIVAAEGRFQVRAEDLKGNESFAVWFKDV